MNALLVINPKAGNTRQSGNEAHIRAAFAERGYACDTVMTAGPGDAERIARERAGDYDLLICCGGDGTLNETVNGLAGLGHAPAIAYLPAGTTNDFARTLGLSPDLRRTIQALLDGRRERLDLGCLNGRRFIYSASFGLFVKSSYATPQSVKNLFGRTAYFLEGAMELPATRPYSLRVEDGDGHVREGEYLFGAVSNATSLGGFLHYRPEQVDLRDGLHEVLLIRYPNNPAELGRILRSSLSGEYGAEGIEFFRASRLSVTGEDGPEWSLDGEKGPSGRALLFETLPSAAEFLLPGKTARGQK